MPNSLVTLSNFNIALAKAVSVHIITPEQECISRKCSNYSEQSLDLSELARVDVESAMYAGVETMLSFCLTSEFSECFEYSRTRTCD